MGIKAKTTLMGGLLALVGSGASGGLVGDTVSLWRTPQLTGDTTLDSFAIVTDPGYEFESAIGNNTLYTVDLGPTSIRLDSHSSWFSPWFNTGHAPSSIELRDLDFGPGLAITGVAVSFSSGIGFDDFAPDDLPAFSADNVEFNADTVRILYGGHTFEAGSWIQIDLIVTPAPASAGLLGVAGLVGGRRRRPSR